jgi:stalled ribosome rescue protein Dom34
MLPDPNNYCATILMSPYDWKRRVADYIAAGRMEAAQQVLDTVGATADEAINSVNVLATRHGLEGFLW